jgi:dsRNA-specific ribonuclease
MRCFNAILFENGGKTYGKSPHKRPEEILPRLSHNVASKIDRTYFFVPLVINESKDEKDEPEMSIDWKALLDVLKNVTTPAIESAINPKFFTALACILVGSLAIELIVCSLESTIAYEEIESSFMCEENDIRSLRWSICGLMSFGLSIVAVLDKLVPPKRVPTAILFNRFMKQPIGFRGSLFATNSRQTHSSLTALSPLLPANVISAVSNELKEKLYASYKLNLDVATHKSYYMQRFGEQLKYPHEKLIKARQILRHIDHDFTVSSPGNVATNELKQPVAVLLASNGYLIPELVSLLPMPRDLLYISQHSRHFMTALERNFGLKRAAKRLLCLQANANSKLVHVNMDGKRCERIMNSSSIDFLLGDLINKATEIGTKNASTLAREDERLESLGDVVLLFLVVINKFSSYADQYGFILDDFKAEIDFLGKNRSLVHGALRLGLHRVCFNKLVSIASWRSAYTTNSSPSSDAETFVMKRLSNTLESLLGATYLIDGTGAMSVGILNEIAPCFEQGGCHEFANAGGFNSKCTCFNEGYQFKSDVLWASELNRITEILRKEPTVL